MFTDLANPYGSAAFEKVAYPMPELANKRLMRKVGRQIARGPRRQPSQLVRDFLLNYNG